MENKAGSKIRFRYKSQKNVVEKKKDLVLRKVGFLCYEEVNEQGRLLGNL